VTHGLGTLGIHWLVINLTKRDMPLPHRSPIHEPATAP
jgi:hypothetical protein